MWTQNLTRSAAVSAWWIARLAYQRVLHHFRWTGGYGMHGLFGTS